MGDKKINHWCIVCGAGYHACDSCKETNGYRTVADTPEHYQLYLLVCDYRDGKINKEQMQIELKRVAGITKENYLTYKPIKDSVLNQFKNIFSEDIIEPISDSANKPRRRNTKKIEGAED